MQIAVTSVAASGADDILVGVEMRDREHLQKERFLISTELYADLQISKGECSRELYELLESESKIYAAYKRGLYVLGFGACSEKMLVSKLVAKGFEREASRIAAERIRERGFLSEENNARREAERLAAKLWGETRIRAQLCSKGYDSDSVDDALFALEDSGVDFEDNCIKLVESKCKAKKLPSDRSELQKLIASVMRYGYSASQVKHALSQISSRKPSIYD